MQAQTMQQLQEWVGRTEHARDVIAPARVAALAATLDRDDPWPAAGSALPPLWHWILCTPAARQSALGPDGHPARGGFLPPVPLPRRMWAGGRLHFHAPLHVGHDVERRSEVLGVETKEGRTGPLVFVRVGHRYSDDAGGLVTEEHDIVYRAAPPPGEAATPAAAAAAPEAQFSREIRPDDVLLFRYSALTFNGHRIHYDRRYATGDEGYPGLVVHGPLIATLLVELLRAQRPGATVSRFTFRALQPLFDLAPFRVNGRDQDNGTVRLWSTGPQGTPTMDAEATLA